MCSLFLFAIYSLLENVVVSYFLRFFPMFASVLSFWYTDQAARGLFCDRGNGIAMCHAVISTVSLCFLPPVSPAVFFHIILSHHIFSFFILAYQSYPRSLLKCIFATWTFLFKVLKITWFWVQQEPFALYILEVFFDTKLWGKYC